MINLVRRYSQSLNGWLPTIVFSVLAIATMVVSAPIFPKVGNLMHILWGLTCAAATALFLSKIVELGEL